MATKRQSCVLLAIAVVGLSGCYAVAPSPQKGSPGPTPSPQPTVTSISPAAMTVAGASFTLTVNGTNFVSTSQVQWNGSVRTTTFVSSTQLTAQIDTTDLASAGTAAVTVSTPAPGGGTSSSATFTIDNLAPAISSITPSASAVSAAAFTLTVTGTNFVASSTIQWNASARPTTFVSATQLQAQITASDIATAGTDVVTVSTPAPGGGTSGPSTFTVNNPAPSATSLSPNSAFAGTSAFTLTVTGTNFVSSSVVQWNGAARATTLVSSTTLSAAITAADINAQGTATVTVSTPSPGGGTSAGLTFTVKPPGPAITLLSPSSAVAGSAAFQLTVTGANFVPASIVQWNGSARTTTFVSSTSLQAAITPADIATAGAVNVTVSNPPANGGVSGPSTFFTGTSGGGNFAVITINQAAQDIVYDPTHQQFYLSVTGTAATHPNTICIVNPATGTIPSSQAAGSNPHVLAISDDSQFLYAGIDGADKVQRFTLPALTTDISYSLGSNAFGNYVALDLQVAPHAPHTTAVSLANTGVSPAAQGGITIFDDATARPTTAKVGSALYGSLQWASDASAVYAANNESTGFDFYKLSVDSSGITPNKDFAGAFSSFSNHIHFDSGSNLVYADEGHAVSPSTGLPAGNFNAGGLMVPDSSLNTAFFIPNPSGSGNVTIDSFDQTHFTPITSITVTGISGTPTRLIRWAQNGLAFITSGATGQVVLVGGNFISPAPTPAQTAPPSPAVPPAPAANAPTITLLNPSSVAAGGVAFTLNVTGTNFVASSAVQWNGSARTTTFLSSTSLQASISAADIAGIGAVRVTVANPAANGGVSAPSSFFVGSSAGTSTGGAGFAATTISQTSKDIAFDRAHQEIFLSVPNISASGNAIAVLDLATATIVGAQFAGSNPDILAISDDDQFLYAGIDGSSSVQRFTLPAVTPDISYPLGMSTFSGPYRALDLQVAPGLPHTSAVTLAVSASSPSSQGGITIFDDEIGRPTIAKGFGPGGGGGVLYDSLQWGSDATALYAANNEDTGFDFYKLVVNSTGVTLGTDFPGVFSSFSNKIHFDSNTKLIYADEGHIVNPATGSQVGTFNTSGLMVEDSTLNKAFFLTGIGSPTVTITSFDLTLFTQIDSITVSGVTGKPLRLLRWGQNGLAFNTDGGQITLVAGHFIR